ncbi:EthD domain-containing protein [Nocardioides mangrovi]|uniref:EthD domain-containing protein n=1 Tax=Nocardioides mangrovi TaxID=2874580 RepID=A0ABS7U9H5_9ACTN|nr:EthD domain-containing protein [Nocardioides mangrovi]MBZ5737629.1 EthD domain-containing protein [Nocardioides mangrovi]
MTKNVFLLWDLDPARLHDPELHDALRDAGADRLQLNVDDDHVAGAMRIPHFVRPVEAIVMTWDADAKAVAAALGAAGGTVHGYSVEERRRLDPPESWDGSRADALANVAILRRPAELERAEWLRRWMVEHTPIAIRTQATFGYVQNIVQGAVTPDAPAVDAFVEELFPSAGATDMHAFYGSRGDDAELNRRLTELMASVARIGADHDLDLVPSSRYLYALGE